MANVTTTGPTPGPWVATEYEEMPGEWGVTPAADLNAFAVAYVYEEADAHLIAAAPDLLAAAEAAVNSHGPSCAFCNTLQDDHVGSCPAPALLAAIQSARANERTP
ncbi:hypothetical protein LCGC14_0391750 [marine sediment metagenome]|uniref:Uncharacterized protein n=1 Tax=marine sediment metagenome TaxID=412755 RepID=A0A0F9T5D7_9ZZZZ